MTSRERTTNKTKYRQTEIMLAFLFFLFLSFIPDNIFHLDVHYVWYNMLVQRFEPQGRRFTNVHLLLLLL